MGTEISKRSTVRVHDSDCWRSVCFKAAKRRSDVDEMNKEPATLRYNPPMSDKEVHPNGDAVAAGTRRIEPQPSYLAARWNTHASRVITAIVVLAAFHAAAAPFRAGASWLLFVQDDCFYYLKIAENLATGHGSTFNGIVPTNGYHPLWLLTLTFFRFVFRSASFISFIAASVVAATIATYVLARGILQRSSGSPLVVNALAASVAAFSMLLFFTGMEVILAIPLVLLFILVCLRANLERHDAKHAFGLGLLVSAMVLARLDTILLATLCCAALLAHPRLRPQITRAHLLGVALGLLPLLAYFGSNHILFDTWLPVSGMAKQLKSNDLPSIQAWHSLYGGPIKHPISFIPIVLALPLIPTLYRRLSDNEQVLYPVVLLWPFVYVLMLSSVSDWPLWMWYFYPLRPALCIALVLLLRWQPVTRLARHWSVAVLLALFAVGKLFTGRWSEGDMGPMVDIGADVQRFALSHPGVYAMGDRAGSVGYLLSQPLVQTEGLVMDRSFLESIRHAGSLREALAPYKVRFYIATQKPPYAPCFHAVEPIQAGPASPHLTQDFCHPPAAIFDQGDARTAVYDLRNP